VVPSLKVTEPTALLGATVAVSVRFAPAAAAASVVVVETATAVPRAGGAVTDQEVRVRLFGAVIVMGVEKYPSAAPAALKQVNVSGIGTLTPPLATT
jgi:hypothetical protein